TPAGTTLPASSLENQQSISSYDAGIVVPVLHPVQRLHLFIHLRVDLRDLCGQGAGGGGFSPISSAHSV
ncbi:MAG: hypothetical protein IJU53_04870, partial [Thermoguttaceae bacterium]|nr:hypothetical protein [Thermoguttaceae bacterium]